MPDFNQYSTNTPDIRPEIPKTGLSLLVSPDFNFQSPVDWTDTGSGRPGIPYTDGILNPFKGLGLVPITPGAVTPYDESKRYNNSSLQFNPLRDNEDLYAKNQGFFKSAGSGLARLVLTTGTKLGTGLGYLAGLMGIGNDSEKYGTDFNAWVAGAADNGLKQWFERTENDKIKQDWLPIYQEAADRNKGFFARAATDLNFWTEDVTDGAAFMASAFVPGMAIAKLNLGVKALRGLSVLKNLAYADEATALASDGISGMAESSNLLKEGLGANIESPTIAKTITPGEFSTNAMQKLPRVISWIDNARAARAFDVGLTTVINTASEAMFEADGVKQTLLNTLTSAKNPDGSAKYTRDQINSLIAKGAGDTFKMNLAALSVSNLWEANLMFKKLPSIASRYETKGILAKGLWDDATLAKKTLGQKAWAFAEPAAEGILAEGIWEENIQLAIQRMNETPNNADLDFGDKLKGVARQYAKQTGDAFAGNDPEAAANIGIGGLIGALAGKVLHQGNNVKDNVINLNARVNAFKTLGNIYQSNADGSIKLDKNNSPVLDMVKLKTYQADLNKVLNLQKVADNLDHRGSTELAQVYKDELFAKFAKAHFDNGLGSLLDQKLNDTQNLTKNDLYLLGYDPDSKDETVSQAAKKYQEKAKALKELYDNISQNALPLKNDKKGDKRFAMNDALFYLSARTQSLDAQVKQAASNYEKVKGDTHFNDEYNAETDTAVDGYNERYEQLKAAQRQTDIAYRQSGFVREATRATSETRRGVTVESPSRLSRVQKANPSTYIQLPEDPVALNDKLIKDRQTDLDKYVKDNKEQLDRLKKDAKGRYLYETANKNNLPSAKEMERQQIIQTEMTLARNATTSVMSRLADPRFGEKYYDEQYSKVWERHARENGALDTTAPGEAGPDPNDDVVLPKTPKNTPVLNEDDVDEAYTEAINTGEVQTEKGKVVDHLADKIAKGEKLNEKEEAIRRTVKDEVEEALKEKVEDKNLDEVYSELSDLRREKEVLDSNDDRTIEQDERLQEIGDRIEDLENLRDVKQDEEQNEYKVENSNNIRPQDKEAYKEVLNKITQNRQRVVKFPDHYEVDGKRFNKVSVLIGDIRTENPKAAGAGYIVDDIVKAYFNNGLSEQFKNDYADKISEEAYNEIVGSLDRIKSILKKDGEEIVASNVVVFDEEREVAGEIDLIAVDKKGNFKLYEVQARRNFNDYGKTQLGLKIRDVDNRRMTAYRNIFANQYGVVPASIGIKFPFQIKYDKEAEKPFIESVKLKKEIRFAPVKDLSIKLKVFKPVRADSKFDNFDILTYFGKMFVPSSLPEIAEKLNFLFRNVTPENIRKSVTAVIRNSTTEQKQNYEDQAKILNGEKVPGYQINQTGSRDDAGKYIPMDNLYSLVSGKEVAFYYEDQLIGFLPPSPALAYKDKDGNFKILDETTPVDVYTEVTGNSKETYGDFKKIVRAYKSTGSNFANQLASAEGGEVKLDNKQLQELFDPTISFGQYDFVKNKNDRPKLSELDIFGVKVGAKQVAVVVNVDNNDSAQVMMDKTKRTDKAYRKLQEVDKWVNANIDDLTKVMTDKNGNRVTDYVAIVELPDGTYKPIALRNTAPIDLKEQFIDNIGDKFTAATRKNVFKNSTILMVPKYNENMVNLNIDQNKIISKVYQTEDVNALEKSGVNVDKNSRTTNTEHVNNFLATLTPEQTTSLNKHFGIEAPTVNTAVTVSQVIPYSTPEDNKYKPETQLKFNQGTTHEAVRIVSDPDFIELISIGAKIKNALAKGTKWGVPKERQTALEGKYGMTAIEANNEARRVAKENRSETQENIIIVKAPGSVNRTSETATSKIIKGYENALGWDNINDYLEDLKNCKI